MPILRAAESPLPAAHKTVRYVIILLFNRIHLGWQTEETEEALLWLLELQIRPDPIPSLCGQAGGGTEDLCLGV